MKGRGCPATPSSSELAGSDRSRDQVYLSRLSMNYDPGRWPKYIGSLLIVVGIGIVYYLRGDGGTSVAKPLAVSHAPPTKHILLGTRPRERHLCFSSAATSAQKTQPLDWTTWRHLPVFSEGRVAPLDTFARETVGRSAAGQIRR